MDRNGPAIVGAELAEFLHAGDVFFMSYGKLVGIVFAQGRPLFALRCKHHYSMHLVYDQTRIMNGRCASNFMDEDFVGKAVKVAALTHPRNMPRRTLQRLLYVYRSSWDRKRKRAD